MATVEEKSTLSAVKIIIAVILVIGCSVEGELVFIDYDLSFINVRSSFSMSASLS